MKEKDSSLLQLDGEPSWELFEDTTQDYQDHVLLSGATPRLAIEAGTPFGWERYVENSDAGVIGLKHISEKMKGIKNIESFVEKCVEKYHYIYHKGWVYGRQWSIDDVNKISNDNITLDNFDISNKEVTK